MWAPRAILLTAICLAGPSVANADEEIVFCDLGMTKGLATANATFTVIYQLDVDDSGKVTRVTKGKNDFLPDAKASACLRRWTFDGPARRLTVLFRWEHAVGWTSVSITDRGVSRRIRFEPHWTP